MFTNKQPKPIDLCANNRLGNAGYLSEFLKIGANQAQNLHIISFEAAALSAELSPATQVAMCPLAAKGLHGHNAGNQVEERMLGLWILQRTCSQQNQQGHMIF